MVNYEKTIKASFIGYIVQAIINNFAPLLFLTFRSTYGIPLSKITLLVTINFTTQLVVDFLAIGFVDKIGYRISIILAHVFSAAGLISLAVLPEVFSDPFHGLLVAVMIYAAGGGLLEVLISPIVESCPTDHKEKTMSMLHSFYCWGHVGVVLFSTIFFFLLGIHNWKILAVLWAIIPIANAFFFAQVPFASLIKDNEVQLSVKKLVGKKSFWLLVILMACAGASEQSVSQWASTFAEKGLGVSKVIGDLAGPMMFAVMMGSSRAIYGKYGHKINLNRFMTFSIISCIFSYLIISFSPWPALALVGCGLCGASVGILWPGTFSTASSTIKGGGTAMFAFLALAGDVGCAGGPTLVGMVSSKVSDNLKIGILAALIFPILFLVCLLYSKRLAKT